MTNPIEPIARAIAYYANGTENAWRNYQSKAEKVLEQVEILQRKKLEHEEAFAKAPTPRRQKSHRQEGMVMKYMPLLLLATLLTLVSTQSGCTTRGAVTPPIQTTGAPPVEATRVQVVEADMDREYTILLGTVDAGVLGYVTLEYEVPHGSGVVFEQSPDLTNWVRQTPLSNTLLGIDDRGMARYQATFTVIPNIDETQATKQFFRILTPDELF